LGELYPQTAKTYSQDGGHAILITRRKESLSASLAPWCLRCLREFAYAHHAIHPSPSPPRCWQVHRLLAVPAPLRGVRVHCSRVPEQSVASPLCLVGYI